MIHEIVPGFYRAEIPLPDTQLRHVNSYIIKGKRRSLIVDAGWYDEKCLVAMKEILKKLAIDPDEADFFITHHHIDHIGLVFLFANVKSTIFMAEPEGGRVRDIASGRLSGEVKDFSLASGFPDLNPDHIVPPEVVEWYGAKTSLTVRYVGDGDSLQIGEYHFACVATPGHSPGHMCLYEPEKRLLIAGDHLLGDITPSIQARLDGRNPLKEYLASLKKIAGLDIKMVLPGHRMVFDKHRERISQIEEHHRHRNNEVIHLLQESNKNAYEVASRMSWNIGSDSWGSFPIIHSFFATGEAFAHLTYLEDGGDVRRDMKGPLALFSLVK